MIYTRGQPSEHPETASTNEWNRERSLSRQRRWAIPRTRIRSPKKGLQPPAASGKDIRCPSLKDRNPCLPAIPSARAATPPHRGCPTRDPSVRPRRAGNRTRTPSPHGRGGPAACGTSRPSVGRRQSSAASVITWVQPPSGRPVMTGSEPPARSVSTVRSKSAGSSAPLEPAVSLAISPIIRF